jgi:hypothetical protein
MTSHYFTLQCDPRYRQGAICWLIEELEFEVNRIRLGYCREVELEWVRQQLEECRS